jgi:hypothetical protein
MTAMADSRTGAEDNAADQRNTRTLLLEELPGHDDALDLVGALADLGDRGPGDSFRR